jgi:multicomponent K+:H+ antiporter subunit E
VVPRLLHGFLGPPTRPRALGPALRFTAVVLWDIVVSNITVARIVLTPVRSRSRPGCGAAGHPQHPTAITLLATIITTTPGTVSCVVDEARGEILVHALDCDDAGGRRRRR